MAGRSAALSSVRIHSTTAPSLVLIIPDGRARFEAALDQARHFRAMSDCDALPADKSTLRRGVDRVDRYRYAALPLCSEVNGSSPGTFFDLRGIRVQARAVPVGAAPEEAQIQGREAVVMIYPDHGGGHSSNDRFVGLRRLFRWKFRHAVKVRIGYAEGGKHLLAAVEALPGSVALGALVAEK
eukprot:CAMPEP_0196203414 /NCGR_PEP_ID=MMETSP0912-20130531/5890_1 /TAXON_ID=49265 /ORGANISM="Thalassiosira rotula, Strain GSO102" /LENGTH=182 /DNA_ID=CAMNT_0041477523 /DNA_START=513 /DNA_END=1060 /DNA_ORIENTATION=-